VSDGSANLNLNVTVTAQIEAALAKIRELSMAARTDTSQPVNTRAKAIADEIAMTRVLHDEQERAQRGGGSITKAPPKGTEAYVTRKKSYPEVADLLKTRLAGLDQGLQDEVTRLVGTPTKQRSYGAGLAYLPQQAAKPEPGTPASVKAENQNIARSAGAETARLNAAAADEEFTGTLLGLDVATKNFWATMELLRSGSTQYLEAMKAGTVAQKKLNADVTAAASSERSYIESTALLANTRRRLQQETVLQVAGVKTAGMTPQQVQDKAAETTRRLGITDRTRQTSQAAADPAEIRERAAQRAAQAKLSASVREESLTTAGYTQDKARSRVALQQEHLAIREQTRALNIAGVGGGEGTLYQRATAAVSPTARLAKEGPTGAESLLSKGLTSAQYAIGGMASGALIFGIIDAVKEATKLQMSLAGLQGQLNAIGRGDDFSQMRDGIKAISNETGIASTEVTRFVSRLAGLFNDPERALTETTSAMRLAVVSGTDMKTLLEELVPTARAFDISIGAIGDAAVSLHDKYGVAEEDMLQFFGATAAASKAAGFTFAQLGPIGAAAANSVGVSLNVAGEQFNKSVETIRNNADKVFAVYQRRPDTKGLGQPIIEALGRGDGGEAFKLMLASYDKLDAAQQQNLIRVSGSRREWALLSGLFSRSDELLGNIVESESGAGEQTGSLDKRFKEISATILQTNERIRDLIRNLVEGLVSSGIGGALNFIMQSFEKVLNIGSLLLKVFSALNDKLKFGPFQDGGLLVFLTQIVAGIFLASKAWTAYTFVKTQQARASAILAAREAELGITTTATAGQVANNTTNTLGNTAAKQENIIITTNMMGQTVEVAAATGAATTAEAANTATVVGNTEAKVANEVITANMAGQTVVTGGATAAAAAAPVVGAAAAPVVGAGLGAAETAAITGGGSVFATVGKNLFGPLVGVARDFGGKIAATFGVVTAGAASRAAASSAVAGFEHLPPPPLTAGGVRAVSGAGLGSAATSAGGIGAMVVGGIVATNWARDQAREGGLSLRLPVVGEVLPGGSKLVEQSDKYKQELQGLTQEQLQATIDDGEDVLDGTMSKIQEAFFDVDLPQTSELKELHKRAGADGRKTAGALALTGKTKEFTQKISEGNLKLLDDFVKQNDEGRGFATEHGLTNAGGDPQITRENLEKAMPGILSAAENGEEGANDFLDGIHRISTTQQSLADMRKGLDDAMAATDTAGKRTKEAVDLAGGMDAYLNKQYDPKGALETGQISPSEFLAQIDQNIATKRVTLGSSQQPDADYAALNAEIRVGEQFRDAQIQRRIDILAKTTDAESTTPKADILARELAALSKRARTDQFAALPKLIDMARQRYEEDLAAIQDPIERYRLATEGRAVDPAIQALDLQDQIRNLPAYGAGVNNLLSAQSPEQQDALMKEVAEESVRTGESIKTILTRRLQERKKWMMLFSPGADTSQIDAALAALAAAPEISTEDTMKENQQKADRTLEQGLLKQTEAQIAVAKSLPGGQGRRRQAQLGLQSAQARLAGVTKDFEIGGPGAATQADIDNAQAAVNDAYRTIDDVTRDTANAMLEWDVLKAYGNPVKQNIARLRIANKKVKDAYDRSGGDVTDPDYIKAQQEAYQQQIAVVTSQHENALAQMDWAEINAGEFPIPVAMARLDKAKRVLQFAIEDAGGDMTATPVIKAAQDVRRMEVDLVKAEGEAATARYAVVLALAERDPLKTALLNQSAAAEALERARGTAAEQQALADKIRADHAVEDAISEIYASRADLAIALAGVAGDPVKAAQLGAAEAKRKLDQAIAEGRGEAEVNSLRGAFATATEGAASAGRSEAQSIIDFQLAMGEITTQQAIESLRLILNHTRMGTEEYRSLAMKIYQLEQQAGADLQFNLPTQLALPTLYESRRLSQGTAAGIGYQDNRNVALVVQVNGAQDAMAVTNQVMAAFSSAMGAAPTYTPQIGVGI
jgi:hypothetical protein